MTKLKSPGRPPVFFGAVKAYIVRLLRKTGNITHTRKILSSAKNTKFGRQRDLSIVPEPLNISVPTLRKFAAEKDIEFDRGRPVSKAA